MFVLCPIMLLHAMFESFPGVSKVFLYIGVAVCIFATLELFRSIVNAAKGYFYGRIGDKKYREEDLQHSIDVYGEEYVYVKNGHIHINVKKKIEDGQLNTNGNKN